MLSMCAEALVIPIQNKKCFTESKTESQGESLYTWNRNDSGLVPTS